ncbi:DM13 domain-containing protein [Nakamurella sp.]|uniref:DM13 domain-containing protein n=1 Tax=Nakamurella sp. TaxID=1869182 RepID=UPI0037832507
MNDLDTRPAQTGRRSRKKIIIGTVVVVAVLAGAVGLALFQPWKLFTRSTVDEGFPVAAAAPAALPSAGTSAPAADPTTGPAAEPTGGPTVEPTGAAAEPPAAEPVVLTTGTFVDGEHTTTGTATIFQLPDGSRILRLENFSTSDGPDVDVALSDQAAGGDDWGKYDDTRYVGLGDLKGTDGNQNYEIPADVDLSGLNSVVIWCDRFNVAFGTAAITV